MNDIKVNGLVIRAINYLENDKLLTLLTLERGKILAKIKGCKSPKSKIRFAAAPLAFGEYILNCKNNRYLVIGCTSKESFSPISEDLDKFYGASVILEMVNKLIQDDEDCKDMLILVLKLLKNLTYTSVNPFQITVISMLNVLKSSGFQIKETAIDIKNSLCYFSLMDGSIIDIKSFEAIRISFYASECIMKASKQNIDNIEDYGYDNLVYRECISILDKYFSYQIEQNLKSTKELLNMLRQLP